MNYMKKTVKYRCINVFRGATCTDIYVQVKRWYGWRTLTIKVDEGEWEERHFISFWEERHFISFINLNSFECYRKIKEQFHYNPKDILLIEYPALTQYWPY